MIKLQSPAESRALPDGYADICASPQWFAVRAVENSRTDGFREVEVEFPSADGSEVTFYTVVIDNSGGGVLLPRALAFGDSDVLWRSPKRQWHGLESAITRALMFGAVC